MTCHTFCVTRVSVVVRRQLHSRVSLLEDSRQAFAGGAAGGLAAETLATCFGGFAAASRRRRRLRWAVRLVGARRRWAVRQSA